MHPPRLPLLFVPLPLLLLLLLLFRWQVSKTTAAVVPSAQSSSSACQSLWFCEKEISGTNLATTREIVGRPVTGSQTLLSPPLPSFRASSAGLPTPRRIGDQRSHLSVFPIVILVRFLLFVPVVVPRVGGARLERGSGPLVPRMVPLQLREVYPRSARLTRRRAQAHRWWTVSALRHLAEPFDLQLIGGLQQGLKN